MSAEHCVCCGTAIQDDMTICFSCEHGVEKMQKLPSEAQIKLADEIAIALDIEFPMTSSDFTAATYWKFIHDNIEEMRNYFDDDEARGGGFYDDLMFFSPLNQ